MLFASTSLAALWWSETSAAWMVSAAAWCIRTISAFTARAASCEMFATWGWSDSEDFSGSIIKTLACRRHKTVPQFAGRREQRLGFYHIITIAQIAGGGALSLKV